MTVQPSFLDDIVGLDDPARLDRFYEQLAGVPLRRPVLSAGLASFRRLPPPEPPMHVRTRMAGVIAQLVAANNCVTREDLEQAGFTVAEIAQHFTAARRAARVADMAV